MKEKIVALVFIGICFFSASSVFGSGWLGFDEGAKARGMGVAFTGLADDPTAVCYNPAGIVQLKGTQVSLGFTAATIDGSFESNGTSLLPGDSNGHVTDLSSAYAFLPNLYITHQVNEKLFIGFGEYTEFGNLFGWPNSSPGRYAPSGKLGELETVTLNPVAAYKVTDRFSVALGGKVQTLKADLRNKFFTGPGSEDVSMKIKGSGWGEGWTAAMLYKALDEFSIGFNYRSKVRYSINDANVRFTPQVPQVQLVSTGASMNLTFPQYASLGIAWNRGPLTVTLDTYWVDWSEEKEMGFNLDNPVANQNRMISPMNWKDTWSYAIGSEYRTKAFGKDLSLRAGFLYDPGPTPATTVNPAGFQGDCFLYNLGLGTKIGSADADFYTAFVHVKDRTWNNDVGIIPGTGGLMKVTGEFKDYYAVEIGHNITFKF